MWDLISKIAREKRAEGVAQVSRSETLSSTPVLLKKGNSSLVGQVRQMMLNSGLGVMLKPQIQEVQNISLLRTWWWCTRTVLPPHVHGDILPTTRREVRRLGESAQEYSIGERLGERWLLLGKWRCGLKSVSFREAILAGERGRQEGSKGLFFLTGNELSKSLSKHPPPLFTISWFSFFLLHLS